MYSDPGLTFFNYCQRQENAQMSKSREEAGTLHPAKKKMLEKEAWFSSGDTDSFLSKLTSTDWPKSRVYSLTLPETGILRDLRAFQSKTSQVTWPT